MGSGKGSEVRQEYPKHPFQLSIDQLKEHLGVHPEQGLSASEATQKRSQYGENKLMGEGGVKWYSVLLKQVSNAMILVLLLAMALSYGVSDYVEGGVITAVIVLNVLIGFYQEYQAEKKMDSLRALSSPTATVLRNGVVDAIPSAEVVPGDIVQIKTGDTIPADIRIFEAMNLECDEKILTGEALPVAKDPEHDFTNATELETGVGDRVNMAYSSSTVTKGRGQGIVVFTGMHTEIGKIAQSMQGTKRKANRSMSRKKGGNLQPAKGLILRIYDAIGAFLGLTVGTPLQRKLSKLAYVLFGLAILLAIIVFGVNRFDVTNEVAIYAISTGIAMIPESLIAVLTITFVSGMTSMRKRRVLTRKLSALEALGGITNICSDKTGTLTQGQMVTRKAWIPGVGIYTVNNAEDAANPTHGTITLGTEKSRAEMEAEKKARQEKLEAERSGGGIKFKEPKEKTERDVRRAVNDFDEKSDSDDMDPKDVEVVPELDAFLHSTALCNLATVRYNDSEQKWQTTGDPTEVALQVFARRFELGKKQLEGERGWKQLTEYPFDSTVKRMSVVYKVPDDGSTIIFTKGAVERILDLCVNVGIGAHETAITDEVKEQILEQMSLLADQGLRVLAVARRSWTGEPINEKSEIPREDIEQGLTLLGLAGIYDPPRLETKDAVRECTNAGIRVHMLTGDHPGTAAAIAKEVGIIPKDMSTLPKDVADSLVKTAAEFDGLTDEEIDQMPELPLVIARCAPNTKTRMIAALHRRGKYAAMTGDGVNDGPSLQAADVGIAMGLAGSDVAKGASDIVLTDDNFASIVNAIEEGRRMFDNIQRFVLHLLTSNVGEVVLLVCGLGFQDDRKYSVFPLSPLSILWINMLTSGFPAFGLGREKASYNIMSRPPHDNKKGVFTWQIIFDMIVYGLLMGMLTLFTFVIIVYGPGDGKIGQDCNKSYSPDCDVVFRARAAVFAELTWLILISAWEIKGIRRSMFRLDPRSESRFPFFADIWENKFLFWSVTVGSVVVFPCIYIPGFNTTVFKHKEITWEWALPIVAVFIFVLGMELWKLAKRTFGWFAAPDEDKVDGRRKHGPLSLRQGFFSFSRTNSLAKEPSAGQGSELTAVTSGHSPRGLGPIGKKEDV
ncbi:putative potassium sodium efflux p-type atpase protein [Lasiodiplodia theobromae]|uniref:P-type Na(+) transporter n=1 Tax=Lasiodiplodia theobromae TaxID=45133 RepID=A0A5N5DT00_9PEZI|nr:Potassium sodium efflux p-type ATPAse [Lasiodiplodia theobromae]KAB2580820.1 Sodium transport ATPase 2 [Lasiodiplodia theobromae]KAF4542507.1 Potassium sodium efflux p-type ATPAse [Lasiodiplodia theobromae]KAF9635964.1 putative potassium sodium efflux p-type atpase protein [Lasiodiplodia theobromae]